MPAPTADDLRQAFEAAATALAAFDPAALAAPVPSCPGWDVATLLGHVGKVHRWGTANVAAAGEAVRWRTIEDPPGGDAVLAWLADGASAASAALDAVPDDAPAWTWAGPGTAGWWRRRLAHETVVHRWDAEAASGSPSPVDPAIAVDGLDELLTVFLPRWGSPADDGATVHLHATDADGEWLITFRGDDTTVDHEHAKGDAAVRGRAEDLLLASWGRVPVDRLERFGPPELYDRIRAAAT